MKQNTLKWLSFSLILLSVLSCKKQKGILDNMDSGRFDFICVWEKNGVKDTVTGEVSGPYSQSPYYYFRVKQELGGISSLKDFEVGSYSRMINETFRSQGLLILGKISDEEHDGDHLWVHFESSDISSDTLSGTFTLTRKE